MRRLELLVPALFWPDAATANGGEALHAPDLDTLFARGARAPQPGPGVESWLAQRFALDADAELPLAALALAGDGGAPGGRIWMRADPVHLGARGGELFLTRGADLGLDAQEAGSMVAALNDLFGGDGLRFEARRPDAWYVALERMPRLRTVPLGLAHGRSIGALLPTGDDAVWWLSRVSEAQMLLHGLAVSEAREARGMAPVNSLWCWGAGILPARLPAAVDVVFSVDAATRGLGQVSGAQIADPPDHAMVLFGAGGADSGLVRLDAAAEAAGRGDAGAWRSAIVALSTNWVRPALAALRTGRLDRLSVTGFAGRGGVTASAVRADLWRLWRRRPPYATWRP
jgi:hypothetical protein